MRRRDQNFMAQYFYYANYDDESRTGYWRIFIHFSLNKNIAEYKHILYITT